MPLSHCSSPQNHVVAPVPQGLLQMDILNWRPWKNCTLPTGNLSFMAQCQWAGPFPRRKADTREVYQPELIHSNWKGVTLEQQRGELEDTPLVTEEVGVPGLWDLEVKKLRWLTLAQWRLATCHFNLLPILFNLSILVPSPASLPRVGAAWR